MTVFEKIKRMNVDEFVELLDKYEVIDDAPWIEWFDNNYCKRCKPEIARYKDSDKDMEFAWCELHDKCRFFQDMDEIPSTKQTIKMWLEGEVDE